MMKIAAAAMAALAAAGCDAGREPAPPSAAQTPAERGRMEFRACAVCHAVDDPSKRGAARLIGPSLYRISGAPSARQADYAYSQAMLAAGLTWDDATLDAFIRSPSTLVPGTRMAFVGEADAEKRAALIAYLATLQ